MGFGFPSKQDCDGSVFSEQITIRTLKEQRIAVACASCKRTGFNCSIHKHRELTVRKQI